MTPIATQRLHLQTRIEAACQRTGRHPTAVRLLAVTKTRSIEEIQQAMAAGLTLFGENRVQEAATKWPPHPQPGLERHLIGPLQRNKVKTALTLFDTIQSVDSLSLAEELHRHAPHPLPILLQVNIGREPQKHGLPPEAVIPTLRAVAKLDNLRVGGLMTVPPFAADPEAVRPHFRALADLARRLTDLDLPGVTMTELSMGMSHDFVVAVEEGATLVRIGSALFEPPQPAPRLNPGPGRLPP